MPADPQQALTIGQMRFALRNSHSELYALSEEALTAAARAALAAHQQEPHQAYADPIDGGWAGYQAACHDCEWRSPTIHDDKGVAQDEAAEHRAGSSEPHKQEPEEDRT